MAMAARVSVRRGRPELLLLQGRRALSTSVASQRADFKKNGFVVLKNVLDRRLVQHLNDRSRKLCANPDYADLQRDKYTGSLIPVTKDDAFGALVAHDGALATMGAILSSSETEPLSHSCSSAAGVAAVGPWMSGFVISKPPHSPSLGWHQDGWFWDQGTAAYGDGPSQVFAMFKP